MEADQDDLDFLKNFLNNPALKSILQVRICVLTGLRHNFTTNYVIKLPVRYIGQMFWPGSR